MLIDFASYGRNVFIYWKKNLYDKVETISHFLLWHMSMPVHMKCGHASCQAFVKPVSHKVATVGG